jgi:hypothetical protein
MIEVLLSMKPKVLSHRHEWEKAKD